MSAGDDLDQQYLEFVADTVDVFGRFPHLEPLRHFIFRELLVQRRSIGLKDEMKYVMQRAWQSTKASPAKEQSDVLIWLESSREVIVDALLPIYQELISRRVNVQLVSYGGPSNLPSSAMQFQHRPNVFPPAWAKPAWEHLCRIYQRLQHDGLYRSFAHTCAVAEGFFSTAQRTLDVVRPKVVLCAATNFIGGAAVTMTSRWKGSRPILLQHGMTQAFYTPLISEYMVTWGSSSNDTLANLGVPINRLLPLGSPRHDSMRPPVNGEVRQAFLRSLALPDRPTFVFFSNGNDLLRNGEAPIECAAWLEEAAADNRDWLNVVVRLHPNEDGRIYKDCRYLSVTKVVPDLASTLGGCDVVGSLCSTVLYDALLYEKPVLQFHRHGWPDLADNWKNNYALRIMSSAHLTKVLRSLKPRSDDYRDIVREQQRKISAVFANRGSAGKAIADYVIQNI